MRRATVQPDALKGTGLMGDTLPPPLLAMGDDDRRRVLRCCARSRYPADGFVFHRGEAGDSLHMLVSGHVAVLTGGWASEPIILGLMGPGEVFGEQALVDVGHKRSATVRAVVPAETLVLQRRDFEDICERHPDMLRFLVEVLSARVSRLTGQLADVAELSATTRVYRSLLVLADGLGVTDTDRPIPFPQQMVAAAAGLKLRVTTNVLAAAKRDGLLTISRRRIQVTDWHELKRRARSSA